VFAVQRNTIKRWIRNFNINGAEGLEPKVKSSRRPKLDNKQIEDLQNWIRNNQGNFTSS